jgi:5'-3' exonuclease
MRTCAPQVADCLALAGNDDQRVPIPGIPGIGLATAAGLLQHHGSIPALLELAGAGDTGAAARRARGPVRAAGALKPSVAAKLRDGRQQVLAAYELAKVK